MMNLLGRSLILSFFSFVLLWNLTSTSSGQFLGPGTTETIRKVSELMEKTRGDISARLRGNLIKKESVISYVFKDKTGEIIVLIEAKLFKGLLIGNKTMIEIVGTLDVDTFGHREIIVDSMRVVQ